MNTLTDRLGAVKEQVARLIGDHELLRKRFLEKENEAHEHQRMCDVLKARVQELERENEALRKAERPASGGSSDPGTKERIDELVAEIDRCLELLNP
jgi:regulator of sirC expression with transglutaminase-like and TPR domain